MKSILSIVSYQLSTIMLMVLFFASPLKAQVTIGSEDPPQNFSVLELISNERGLRLPQLTEDEQKNLKLDEFDPVADLDLFERAQGLVIYNKTTNCLEFWNGEEWVSLCETTIGIEGSLTNPYPVCSPEDLDEMRNKPNAHFILCGNIDLTEYLSSGAGYDKWQGSGWMPVGDVTVPFTGSLNGAGYTISGLWLERSVTGYVPVGLFGYIEGGKVINLKVELKRDDSNGINGIHGGTNTCVGGLAGRLFGDGGLISNCSVTGPGEVRGSNSVGGIVGRVDIGKSKIIGCYASVNVNGNNGIGGIVGMVSSSVTIERGGRMTNCYSTGDISGTTGAGGVAGRVENGGSVSYCYATGTISRSATGNSANYIGGVVGRIDNHGSVNSCVALNSSVTTTYGDGVGRITGLNDAGTSGLGNNWADQNMKNSADNTTWNNKGQNQNDGADIIPAGSEMSASWWLTNLGWSEYYWTFTNGQLPELK